MSSPSSRIETKAVAASHQCLSKYNQNLYKVALYWLLFSPSFPLKGQDQHPSNNLLFTKETNNVHPKKIACESVAIPCLPTTKYEAKIKLWLCLYWCWLSSIRVNAYKVFPNPTISPSYLSSPKSLTLFHYISLPTKNHIHSSGQGCPISNFINFFPPKRATITIHKVHLKNPPCTTTKEKEKKKGSYLQAFNTSEIHI